MNEPEDMQEAVLMSKALYEQAREALRAAVNEGAWPHGGLTRDVTHQLRDALAAMEATHE